MRFGRSYYVPRDEKDANNFCIKFFGFVLFIGLIISLFYFESEYREKTSDFEEIRNKIVGISPSQVDPNLKGREISFITDQIRPDKQLVDHDFKFYSPTKTLQLKRIVEYCQWQQFTDYVHDERTGEEVKTYYYIKGWHSTLIPSIIFDQPFAHNNPMRNPFPPYKTSTGAYFGGGYHADIDLTSKLNEFKKVDSITQQVIDEFYKSTASRSEGFRYIGNGYYYSEHASTNGQLIAKLIGQVLEGSILDYQLGDLFSHCEAGDIRVHYEVAIPSEVTIIAKLLNERGDLGNIITSRNNYISLIVSGQHSSNEVLNTDLGNLYWKLIALRIISFFLCWLISHLSLESSGDSRDGIDAFNSFVLTLFLTCLFIEILWLKLYGISISTILLLIFDLFCLLVFSGRPRKQKQY
jgi:hypothetical protein